MRDSFTPRWKTFQGETGKGRSHYSVPSAIFSKCNLNMTEVTREHAEEEEKIALFVAFSSIELNRGDEVVPRFSF